MQSTPSHLRWSLRSCIVLTLLLFALIEGAMHLAHWYASHAATQTAEASDSVDPAVYYVPVGHRAGSGPLDVICVG
jgi:hypothetical protein